MSNSPDSRYSITNSTVELVKSVGGTDVKFASYSNIVFACLDDSQVEQLKKMGAIVTFLTKVKTSSVAPPPPIAGVPTYTANEFLSLAGLIELRNTTDPPLFGEGINIAILGTGIRETHQQLLGRVIFSKNYTDDPMQDGFDHDTGVASIITALAPKCGILNLKVIDDNGEGSQEDVIMAIEDCIAMHDQLSPLAPSVINMSLGEPDDGNINNPLRIACRTAISIGIWVFAASGNSGPNAGSITSPACEQYVFAVGSVRYVPAQNTFEISDVSSRGPTLQGLVKPDAVLFGEDMIVASSQSDTAVANKAGTSFTCPFAAGMGIIYLEGITRKARTLVDLGQLPPANFYYVPASIVIDQQLSKVCVKPAGVTALKDNSYGYGLPFGPLISQNLQPAPSVSLAGFGNIIPIMMIIPLMGGIMKSFMVQKRG